MHFHERILFQIMFALCGHAILPFLLIFMAASFHIFYNGQNPQHLKKNFSKCNAWLHLYELIELSMAFTLKGSACGLGNSRK